MQKRFIIRGIVQGVGFRPFVYRIAIAGGLKGFVRNIGDGVEAVFEGSQEQIDSAIHNIRHAHPPMASVESIFDSDFSGDPFVDFKILKTPDDCPTDVIIPPDIGICDNCRRELLDTQNRRHDHLMISCTDCGPRMSIIRTLPYDRHTTSAGDFSMCQTCKTEYTEPADRRYHAQTIACNDCGPKVWMGDLEGIEAVEEAKRLILKGEVVAIKGIGGFHLACLATDGEACKKIRKIKHRGNEPMAVMVFDMTQARKLATIDECSEKWLTGWQKPIILAPKSESYNLAESVAPGTDKIGIFLPYTPVQVKLMQDMPPIVLTSANIHDEPISTTEKDQLVTDILTNDREIVVPLDDSVARCINGEIQLVRRARGFVPQAFPIATPKKVLALGPQMKSTFAFFWNNKSLVGHHIGEMGNPATFERYRESLAQYRKLFGFEEEVAAYDLHPDYTATKHRLELSSAKEFVAIQHHEAHIASVIAEHGIKGKVIGVAADGTGYGHDGKIWGCEFFIAENFRFTRVAHLLPFRLPGGEVAVKDCKRVAFSLAVQAGATFETGEPELDAIMKLQLEKNINSSTTSSLGRLFDGFSVVAGMGETATFEAELAIKLESAFKPDKPYDFPIIENNMQMIDWRPAFLEALEKKGNISGRFHSGLANAFVEMCMRLREKTSSNTVALSGGCFLNLVFINLVTNALKQRGFLVYTNNMLPPGDGCVSFGQGAIVCANSGGN